MKQSIVIKEVNTMEVLRKPFSALKLALKYVKEQKKELSKDEKLETKFKIIKNGSI